MRPMFVQSIPDEGGYSTTIGIVVPLQISVFACSSSISETQLWWGLSVGRLDPHGGGMDRVYCSSDCAVLRLACRWFGIVLRSNEGWERGEPCAETQNESHKAWRIYARTHQVSLSMWMIRQGNCHPTSDGSIPTSAGVAWLWLRSGGHVRG